MSIRVFIHRVHLCAIRKFPELERLFWRVVRVKGNWDFVQADRQALALKREALILVTPLSGIL
jgi:hypothetical protein